MPPIRSIIFSLIAAALTILLLISSWLYFKLDESMTLTDPIELHIPQGASSAVIAQLLFENGIIHSSFAFKIMVRLNGTASSMQSGYYRFSGTANLMQVGERIREGDVILESMTIAEGLRIDEMISQLAKQSGIAGEKWEQALKEMFIDTDPEGKFLPETYLYARPIDPLSMLKRMHQAQMRVIEKLDVDWLDINQLRIVASIIEKESAVDKERPRIAAVIRNRLNKNMRLQMDPTVIYGLWREDHNFSGNLRRKDLKRPTPWNSYTNNGLPATPICNPGAASLQAAAAPADDDTLYFVADGSGGHHFSTTLKEHEAHVKKWVARERAQQ
ncbi:MAG: endolytic transglycosylase MltG [Mariprofundaceae bacterium]